MKTSKDKKYSIVRQASFSAVGMVYTGPMDNPGQIPRLWESFLKRVPEIKKRASDKELLGIVYCSTDQLKKGQLSYLAAARVKMADQVPTGMTAKDVEGGSYLKYLYQGPVSKIKEAIDYAFGQLVPASGYSLDLRPMIEIYDERYKGEDRESMIEILVPVKN